MEEEKFKKYLKERYEDEISWYDIRSSKNKRYYQCFQWAAIIISASLPAKVVLMPDGLKLITVVFSVLLAIATGALKTFRFEENWINYRTIAETLKKEKHYYDAGTLEYATAEDRERLFVERVEALISRENTLWMAIHTKKEDKEKRRKD